MTPDNRVFFGLENRYFSDFVKFESDYVSNNTALFVLTHTKSISDPDFANAIRWTTDQAWSIDKAVRVDSLATYPLASTTDDDIHVAPILDYVCPTIEHCEPANLQLLNRHTLLNRLVNEDFSSTGVLATFSFDVGALGVVEQINANIEDLATRFRSKYPEMEIVVTGAVPMMSAFASVSNEDLGLLLPISLLTIGTLLYFILGGAAPTGVLLGTGFLAAAFTLGVAGWLGHTINNATSIVPLVVFTLVIANSMHLVVHYLRQNQGNTQNNERYRALKASVESNIAPILVSSATSIVSLLSLSFVDSPPLAQLGQLSALGLFVGTVCTLLVLPILLSTTTKVYISKFGSAIQRSLNVYARKIENGKTVATATALLLSLLLVGLPIIEVDDDFVKYFDESTDFRKNTERATDLLTGPNHLEVLLTTPIENGVFEPSYIHYLGRLTNHLRDHELVSNATSLYDVLEELSIVFDSTMKEVESADAFAQWYLTYELSLTSGQSTTDFIRRDQQQSRVTILLKESTSSQIKSLEKEIYEWHTENSEPFDILVTGENLPTAHLSAMNIGSMIWGLGACICFSAFLIGVLLKNIRIGLIAMLATLVPVALGFGVWGLLGMPMGLASTAIIALTIGIVIDDAVHLIYRFVDGRQRLQLDGLHASAYAVHRAGNAIVTTTIVLICGLGVLLLSPFEVNSSFGACTCLIIAIALIFDLLVFPRLLVWTTTGDAQP